MLLLAIYIENFSNLVKTIAWAYDLKHGANVEPCAIPSQSFIVTHQILDKPSRWISA